VPASNSGTPRPDADDLWQLARGYAICREAENYSPATIRAVLDAVRYFLKFLLGNGLPTSLGSVGPGQIRAYIVHLKNRQAYADHPYVGARPRPLSDSTINNYIRGLSAFWSWLLAEGITEVTPFHRVKIPKAGYKVVVPFSENDISKLLGAIDNTTPTGFRDRCIVLVFLDTGIRLSELTGLRMKDVRLDENLMLINGKGNFQRVVPFGREVRKHLWRYVSRYRPEPARPQDDYLFLSDRGERLTKTRVETMMTRLGQRAGLVGVRASPHSMRHTAALSFLKNNGNVFELQRLLGHHTLQMSQRYCLLSDDDLRRAHQSASPVDNLKMKPPTSH